MKELNIQTLQKALFDAGGQGATFEELCKTLGATGAKARRKLGGLIGAEVKNKILTKKGNRYYIVEPEKFAVATTETVLTCLRAAGLYGITVTKISEMLGDKNRKRIGSLLGNLVKSGKVTREGDIFKLPQMDKDTISLTVRDDERMPDAPTDDENDHDFPDLIMLITGQQSQMVRITYRLADGTTNSMEIETTDVEDITIMPYADNVTVVEIMAKQSFSIAVNGVIISIKVQAYKFDFAG